MMKGIEFKAGETRYREAIYRNLSALFADAPSAEAPVEELAVAEPSTEPPLSELGLCAFGDWAAKAGATDKESANAEAEMTLMIFFIPKLLSKEVCFSF